jgi:adenine-specific DNA methylase
MIKLANDIPHFLIEMLKNVDYGKITDAHYDAWIKAIKENIGKHLKHKSKSAILFLYDFSIRQDFCDLINGYDFKSMPIAKQMAMVPLIKRWANANLPLLKNN